MTPALRRAAAPVLLALVLASSAQAQSPFPGPLEPGNPFCLKPSEETAEVYGPTDIGATTGNQRLSVAVNPEGTLSVLRWPSPSYYDQLRYITVDRDLPRLGVGPNQGAFGGLALTLQDGSRETVWLRDLKIRQRYASDDSDTVVTRFRSRRYRLRVEVDDVVPRGADVLMRRHLLRLGRRSPVRAARLVAFANLNPTATKQTLPTEDWCAEKDGTDEARYVPASDAIVYDITETDGGEQRSVAVAIGANRLSDGHQVGADTYSDHPSASGGPESAYDDAADGGELSGNGAFGPAEVDSALSIPIARRPVTVTFAAAAGAPAALALLDHERMRHPVRVARAKRRSYLHWLERAPLPRRAPAPVVRLAKRALVSLRQAIDERAGQSGDQVAIVASIATQSPYGQDWIRDGAWFNEALHVIGHPDLVERHNDFYVEVQHKLEEGAPPGSPLTTCASATPDGNWFMTNYADGPDAGIFPWEIDEAALGVWTLWRHYELAGGRADLDRVYPAIRRTAEFLMAFHDPATGLPPGTACEDDDYPHPDQPTMHSSGPVLLAMRSAAAAAAAAGQDDDASRYRGRARDLEQAIDERYREGEGGWTADAGDAGWVLWPIRLKRSYSDPRMRAQAELAWKAIAPAFEAPDAGPPRGAYEAKALHGLAFFYRAVDPAGLARVKRGLRWIAEVQAGWQDTGILGEVWYVRDGQVISVVSQPHVWEQILFYLAAVKAYGRTPYERGAPDRLARPPAAVRIELPR